LAHEVAHQWWGHRITPASVEGEVLLAEGIANYCGMKVLERTYGHEHRHLGLDAGLVDRHLARPHVERHLPGAGFGWLRRSSLGLEFSIVFASKRSWSKEPSDSGVTASARVRG
jgi:hypothetical protein